MNQLNHDLKISPTWSLFKFSNYCSDDTFFVYLCSFLFFILYFHCNDRLVQSVERGTIQFIDWFDSGCIVVWLNVIETRLNRVELEEEKKFYYFGHLIQPWLNRLNHDSKISLIRYLFRFSNHCSDDTISIILSIVIYENYSQRKRDFLNYFVYFLTVFYSTK